jgi:hypothetical protein
MPIGQAASSVPPDGHSVRLQADPASTLRGPSSQRNPAIPETISALVARLPPHPQRFLRISLRNPLERDLRSATRKVPPRFEEEGVLAPRIFEVRHRQLLQRDTIHLLEVQSGSPTAAIVPDNGGGVVRLTREDQALSKVHSDFEWRHSEG